MPRNSQLEKVTIILPLPAMVLQPNCTIGSMGGRMMKMAATKRYRKLACEAVRDEQVESAPWEVVGVKAYFYFANRIPRDQDNAVGSIKAAYDGLVDSGLVGNDDYEHMKREMPEFFVDKSHPRVTLEITRYQ